MALPTPEIPAVSPTTLPAVCEEAFRVLHVEVHQPQSTITNKIVYTYAFGRATMRDLKIFVAGKEVTPAITADNIRLRYTSSEKHDRGWGYGYQDDDLVWLSDGADIAVEVLENCPICLCVFDKAVRLFCGHQFCLACVVSSDLRTWKFHTCPLCRAKLAIGDAEAATGGKAVHVTIRYWVHECSRCCGHHSREFVKRYGNPSCRNSSSIPREITVAASVYDDARFLSWGRVVKLEQTIKFFKHYHSHSRWLVLSSSGECSYLSYTKSTAATPPCLHSSGKCSLYYLSYSAPCLHVDHDHYCDIEILGMRDSN